MLKFINFLCKSTTNSTTSLEFEKHSPHIFPGKESKIDFNALISYKHPQSGDNVLHYAAKSGNLALLELIAKNFDQENLKIFFNNTNKDGKNALHEACQNGHFECVQFLVTSVKISVDSLRKGDWTPLMLACAKDNLEIIKFLVNNKADLDQVNKDDWNALHIAVREGHEKIVDFLINEKTVKSFLNRSKNGRTVYHTAALHGHLNVLNLLIVNSKDITLLAKDSDADENNYIFQILNLKDNCGITPFMDALLADHVHIIEHFCETFKNIETVIETRDNILNSCIHLVAQSGSVKCCAYLFKRFYRCDGNDEIVDKFKNDLNQYKMTPLHSSCKNNHPEIIALFSSYFKEANSDSASLKQLTVQSDINGRTPLDICSTGRSQANEQCINEMKTFIE